MRLPALLVVSLVVPVAALAQDAPAPRPTGTTLLDALPPDADIVVDAPDLPALLNSCAAAGLGDAAAWRAAFDAQLTAWGAASADGAKLVRGGDALLAAADGEAMLASIDIKMPGMSLPSGRATLFAMRSTRDQKTLRAAVGDVLDGGLRARYEGEPRTEQIDGRPVLALPGDGRTLYVLVQDGLVVATDHALALGLLSRGLARAAKPASGNRPEAGPLKLVVRHGRGDAMFEGWMWGEGESVQWKSEKSIEPRIPLEFPMNRRMVLILSADRAADVSPLFPVPPPAPLMRAEFDDLSLEGDGIWAHMQKGYSSDKTFAGLAKGIGGVARLVWLGAYADAKIEFPFAGVDRALLRSAHAAAAKSAGDKLGEFIEWKSKAPGKLTGPLGHGPATFLALRCLHDICHGIPPGAVEAPKIEENPRPPIPLPPPTAPKDPEAPKEPKEPKDR